VIFYITYLRELAYNWFKPTLTNFSKNRLESRKATITTTFNSYITFKTNLKKVYKGVDKEYIIE
jgi:hypothetical protein